MRFHLSFGGLALVQIPWAETESGSRLFSMGQPKKESSRSSSAQGFLETLVNLLLVSLKTATYGSKKGTEGKIPYLL